MGWTEYYAYGEKDKKQLMIKDLEQYGDIEVLKSAMVGNVFYGACKTKSNQKIWGIVCLTSLKDGYFAYKDMEETMHPYCYDCPISIIKMLSPTENEQANEWRKRCIERKSKQKQLSLLPIGSIIEVNGEKYYKHAPAYQFKHAFWMHCTDWVYIKATQINDFKVIGG